MMRAYFFGCATVGLLAIGLFLGLGLKSGTPEAHAAERKDSAPVRMGFVSCTELMAKSTECQRGSKSMNDKRLALGKKLGESSATVSQLKMRLDAASDPAEKNRLAAEFVEASRQQEDAQRKGMAQIDEEAHVILQSVHASFEKALKEEVKERSLDVVFGCPINPSQLFKNGQKPINELNLYFRPQAANPLFLAPELDITDAILTRMNAEAEPK